LSRLGLGWTPVCRMLFGVSRRTRRDVWFAPLIDDYLAPAR
jgi:hypothetical protein